MYKNNHIKLLKNTLEMLEKPTDYLIVSEEFAQNMLKIYNKDFEPNFGESIMIWKLEPPMYMDMKVFIDDNLKGDIFKIR